MKKIFASISSSPPQQFEIRELTKRDLLGQQVAVYADSLESFFGKYGELTQRICGIVITLNDRFAAYPIYPLLWHFLVPSSYKNDIYHISMYFLELIDHVKKLTEENAYLNTEIKRENLSLKNAWLNYNETIDRLGIRIEELKNEISARQKIESRLNRRIDFESLVSDVTSKLASSIGDNSDVTVRDVLEKIAVFTGSKSIVIFELNEPNQTARVLICWSRKKKGEQSCPGKSFTFKSDLPFFTSLKNSVKVFTSDISENSFKDFFPDILRIFDKNNSLLALPIESSGLVKGFACFEKSPGDGCPSDEDIRFLKFLCETIIEFLDKSRIEKMLIESEERFREITEMLPEAIVELDQNGLISYANRKFFDLFGYDEDDLKSGIFALDLVAEDQREEAVNSFSRRIRTKNIEPVEYKAMKKDSSLFPSLFHGCFEKGLNEQRKVRGVIFDLTEIKKAEEERLKFQKLESVSLLAGGIAHDFNNLLMGLFGNIEIAKMLTPEGDKAYAFLEIAEQAMENAKNLTNQLLTFSKGGDPIKETLSLGEVILETAAFSLRGSNIKLEPDIQKDLWQVEADKSQISQVISNLIINAQQAMPAGGLISITARNRDSTNGKRIEIIVKDTGIGIPEKYQDKVFDPYFTTKQHGNGLGLAITHSIISKHGGSISLNSILGKGTTFTISLPAKIVEKAEKENVGKIEEAVSMKSFRILVLDDDEFLRDIIESMLKIMGHTVVCLSDGLQAVEEYKKSMKSDSGYDVVITDLTIPGSIGGKEVAEKILAIDPEAILIVSSGYATDPILSEYMSYGFKSRLYKPFRFDDLKKAVFHATETLHKQP
ncbi:PAS domain S-box protein [candidate division WOR-3 bacterium]|nr:PAS domain S-box protein [candidate division WOR-3 bacterium]